MALKKKVIAFAITLGVLIGSVGISYAISGGDTYFTQRDPTNSFQAITFLPLPATPSFAVLDPSVGTIGTAAFTSFGSGLSFGSGAISVANVPESSITNLVSDLALKADISSIPVVAPAYEGTTARNGAFPIFKSITVSGGTAVFNLTADGTSGGTSLCTNGVIQDSVNATVSDSAASYQMAWAFSNSNKTVTVTTNKLTTANILTGILGQSAGNGSVVKLSVWCY